MEVAIKPFIISFSSVQSQVFLFVHRKIIEFESFSEISVLMH